MRAVSADLGIHFFLPQLMSMSYKNTLLTVPNLLIYKSTSGNGTILLKKI